MTKQNGWRGNTDIKTKVLNSYKSCPRDARLKVKEHFGQTNHDAHRWWLHAGILFLLHIQYIQVSSSSWMSPVAPPSSGLVYTRRFEAHEERVRMSHGYITNGRWKCCEGAWGLRSVHNFLSWKKHFSSSLRCFTQTLPTLPRFPPICLLNMLLETDQSKRTCEDMIMM